MPSYVVRPGDPRRVAGAVVRYQVTQPRFVIVVTVMLVVFGLLGATRGAGGAVGGVLLFALLIVLVVGYKRGQLAKTLLARGYRPGSTIEVSADDDALTVAAATGSARHPWAQIEHVRVFSGVVLFRMRDARFVVAVPLGALPGGVAARLAPGN